jgi:hypothetical protein
MQEDGIDLLAGGQTPIGRQFVLTGLDGGDDDVDFLVGQTATHAAVKLAGMGPNSEESRNTMPMAPTLLGARFYLGPERAENMRLYRLTLATTDVAAGWALDRKSVLWLILFQSALRLLPDG